MVDSIKTVSLSKPDLNNNIEFHDDHEVEIDFEMFSVQDTLLNLNPEDWIRGSTPDGIEQRCLELCQAYIGGIWNLVTRIEDVTVKRVTGGFANQLYHVKLNHKYLTDNLIEQPTEVAIKLYQEKQMKNYHHDDSERLNDIVILPIASQAGIGPKVYGIFNDGCIQQFVKVIIYK